jgi:excinuclease UvrABC helicase subunit UvrB
MAIFRKTLLGVSAAILLSGMAMAADARPEKPNINATVGSPELQKLVDQFAKQRDSLLADRAALLEQLKNATADQRKALIDKMEAQQKDLVESQRELAKRIRDEMRKLRETRPGAHH